jgi:PAS domain S-box-containing protein
MSTSEQIEALIASIELTSIATVITNPRLQDNPIIAVNPAFEELTGHVASEVVGQNCRLLRGPDTEPEGSAQLREAVTEGRAAMVELLNYRRDGSSFRNAVMIAPVLGDDGAPILYIGSQMEVRAATRTRRGGRGKPSCGWRASRRGKDRCYSRWREDCSTSRSRSNSASLTRR